MSSVQTNDLIQMLAVCLSSIVAVVSLVISILGYRRERPRLKVLIPDPRQDCYYGWRQMAQDCNEYARIAYMRICLLNNSPVSVGVEDIFISVKRHSMQRISCDNDFWNETVLLYRTKDGFDTDGSCIDYLNDALWLPLIVNAYDTVSGVVLFHNFPRDIKGDCKVKITLRTAIGNIKKKVRIREKNEKLIAYIHRDIDEYLDSIERLNSHEIPLQNPAIPD